MKKIMISMIAILLAIACVVGMGFSSNVIKSKASSINSKDIVTRGGEEDEEDDDEEDDEEELQGDDDPFEGEDVDIEDSEEFSDPSLEDIGLLPSYEEEDNEDIGSRGLFTGTKYTTGAIQKVGGLKNGSKIQMASVAKGETYTLKQEYNDVETFTVTGGSAFNALSIAFSKDWSRTYNISKGHVYKGPGDKEKAKNVKGKYANSKSYYYRWQWQNYKVTQTKKVYVLGNKVSEKKKTLKFKAPKKYVSWSVPEYHN